MTYDVIVDGKKYRLELERRAPGSDIHCADDSEVRKNDRQWRCRLDGREVHLDAVLARPNVLSILIDGKAYEVKRERIGADLHLWVGSGRYPVELRDPRSYRSRHAAASLEGGPRKLTAPMPGKVVRVLVREKEKVDVGQSVVVVEAMKMQNEIKSPKKGMVQKLSVAEGTAVNAGDVLAIVE
jgi:biotin carboxyl carrier protein